jgi:DNA polymerase (family X)
VDIVVATNDPAAVGRAVREFPQVAELVGSGNTKTSFLTHDGLQVDVRAVRPDQLGSALLYFTGSKTHNISLRQRAIDRGWLLSEYGLFDGDTVVASATEEEVYAALEMEFVPPPLREGSGEVEAAAEGRLPRLVSREDILGDMHYHSDRSGDGRSSLEDMVEAAIAAGYRYVAFTDHGEDLTINGSTREEMIAHRDRIRVLDDRYPEIELLFGCELNIGPDGDLDYDPAFRLEFDWCVASIHSHFDLPAEQQTIRILKALADPAVNAIGHLTGRYVGRRPGVEFDVEPILDGLATTGVALEINGALDRLDATADVARLAMERGRRCRNRYRLPPHSGADPDGLRGDVGPARMGDGGPGPQRSSRSRTFVRRSPTAAECAPDGVLVPHNGGVSSPGQVRWGEGGDSTRQIPPPGLRRTPP